MTDERDRVPLILQAALVSTPLLFIGLPAWILVVILQLFDLDARWEVGVVMACVLPVALFLFARLCARHRIIRPDASPLALAVLQSAGAAFGLWLLPHLPSGASAVGGPGGRSGGGPAGAIIAGIIFVAGWIALALFSSGEQPVDPSPPAEPIPSPQNDPAARARRLPP